MLDFNALFNGTTWFMLLGGLKYTILYTLAGFVISLLIGFVIAQCQLSKNLILNKLAWLYLLWFRSTPLLIQLVLMFYGLPILFNIETDAWVVGVISMGLYSGSYVSQIMRGAIISIDRGQMEAGRSLGYSNLQVMLKIILPQAVRRAIAPLTNEFISLTKNSSLLSVITVVELFREADVVISTNYKTLEVYLIAAVMYFVLNNLIGWLGIRLEKLTKTGEELA
ncbi:MAG: amino acid ABC transporter permease [Bifidobacterium aquikefiri]|uniref:Nickel transporter n=1 Tax=Bifidobacterium aquikefiri TaxID=1653207 RepID=A0A261G3Y9_9BIFI|nr:amino acid ABC transporter permease [Bifidobacterium aquikefiri]OZG65736.1 nickel transporter [Bifidobacterium aquikefiri]